MSKTKLAVANGWATVPLEQLGLAKTKKIDPSKRPDELFEVWCVPRFPSGRPEVLPGSDIGSSKQLVQPGDVLLCKINPRINRVWVVTEKRELEQIASSEWVVLRDSGLDERFLAFRLQEGAFREQLCADVSGVGGSLTRARPQTLRKLHVTVAPLAEQRRIVKAIQALYERSDRACVLLDEVAVLVGQLRHSVLHNAFSGSLTADWRATNADVEPADELLARIRVERRERWEAAQLVKFEAKGKNPTRNWQHKYNEPEPVDDAELPDLPAGWCWASMGDAFDVSVGATPSRKESSYWDGGTIPWISSGEVGFCRISTTREAITELGLARTSTVLHPQGTVLLGMIGEGKTRGQAAILDVEACTNQNVAAIRVSETDVEPEYIYHYLEHVYEATRRIGSGNNQQALNKSRVQAMAIPLPPVAEQKQICDSLARSFVVINRVGDACRDARVDLDRLNQSVLAKAFRGELVAQDLTDEPALAMLARIAGNDWS